MANRPKLRWSIFLAAALAALALRLPGLDARPMHTDEAVNAYIVGQVLSGAPFHYDPIDRHGPLMAAVTLPVVRAEGHRDFASLTEVGLRIVPALAGAVTVLLFAMVVEPFGFVPAFVGALLFAFAPLPVYYSRDFIHETIFVAATLGFLGAGWRAMHRPSVVTAAIAGACASLMLTAKETAVLHLAAIGVAILATALANRPSERPPRPRLAVVLAAVIAFVTLTVLLYTWCGRDWSALSGLVQAVPNSFARAHGQGHQKPFWYYVRLFADGWSGVLIGILVLTGLVIAFRNASFRTRFGLACCWLGLYFLLILAVYCAIPYKTPWLALNLWLPASLLVGFSIEFLWRFFASPIARALLFVSIAALVALIARDTRVRVFTDPGGETNPYAYVQTSDDLLGLPVRINDLVAQRHINNPRIAVIAVDPWPLPWYLRKYPQTGFWQPGRQLAPESEPMDFYITSSDVSGLQSQLKDFRPEFFGVRANVLIILWVPVED